jgi:hypothetical protein
MKIPLESITVKHTATIKDALETINNAGYGFAVVVSSNDSKVQKNVFWNPVRSISTYTLSLYTMIPVY